MYSPYIAVSVANPLQRAARAWPGVPEDEVLWLAPLGSRHDLLVFHRVLRRVTTGWIGVDRPCFEGTLEEFSAAVEAKYSVPGLTPMMQRYGDEYRAAIRFLEAVAVLGKGGDEDAAEGA